MKGDGQEKSLQTDGRVGSPSWAKTRNPDEGRCEEPDQVSKAKITTVQLETQSGSSENSSGMKISVKQAILRLSREQSPKELGLERSPEAAGTKPETTRARDGQSRREARGSGNKKAR